MAKYMVQMAITLECYNFELEVERPDGTDEDDVELTRSELASIDLEDWIDLAEDVEIEIDNVYLKKTEKET